MQTARRSWIWLGLLALLALAAMACNLQVGPGAVLQAGTDTPEETGELLAETLTAEPVIQAVDTEIPPLPTEPEQPTETPTPTATETLQPTETPTPTPTVTATPTPIPTYVVLRGKVLAEQANCRYGPGAPYLYKYGVYLDTVLEIIGRTDSGAWVLVQAIGGSNACWVKADLLEIRGDVMNVAPTYIDLPPSPYYGPLTGVSVVRNGDEVIVAWNPLYLRAGDDSEQTPYVVEAWVCQGGALVFLPVGSYATQVNIQDEWGCSQASHARVTAAEKHGYTAFVEVPWPAAVQP